MKNLKIKTLLGLLAMCGGLCAPAAAHAETLTLAPHSNWTLDYADDSCALRRDFGGPDAAVYLEMRQFSPDSSLQMVIASADHRRRSLPRARPSSRSSPTTRGPRIRYAPDEESRLADGLYISFPGDVRGLTFSTTLREEEPVSEEDIDSDEADRDWPDTERDAREQQIHAIEIARLFRDDLILQTGELHAPMEAMRGCLDELLTHWGVDAEAHRTLSRKAKPRDMAVWSQAIATAYPLNMAHRGAQAVLRIRLDVSPEGRATGCHMQRRIGEEQFEQTACELLIENARYDPALDADGNAISSYHVISVEYSFQ